MLLWPLMAVWWLFWQVCLGIDTLAQTCSRSQYAYTNLKAVSFISGFQIEHGRFLKSDGAKLFSASLLNDVGVAWLRFYLALTDKDLIENLSKSKKPKLDLVFEEWDVAGLPWWFLGNLRSNYKSRSNGSTDIQTNQVCRHFKEVNCILFLSSFVFQVNNKFVFLLFPSHIPSGLSASPFCVPVPAFHIRWLVTFSVVK